VNFPVALEGALKLKEISYIHAEGYPAAEMKHGPIALIDDEMPVVFVAPHDEVYAKVVSNMQEVKARGGRIIAITTRATATWARWCATSCACPRLSRSSLPSSRSFRCNSWPTILRYYAAATSIVPATWPRV